MRDFVPRLPRICLCDVNWFFSQHDSLSVIGTLGVDVCQSSSDAVVNRFSVCVSRGEGFHLWEDGLGASGVFFRCCPGKSTGCTDGRSTTIQMVGVLQDRRRAWPLLKVFQFRKRVRSVKNQPCYAFTSPETTEMTKTSDIQCVQNTPERLNQESPRQTKPKKAPKREVHELRPFL